MVEYLRGYTGRSSTACPSAGEWMDAFDDAEQVFCVTITSNLSGAYNSAVVAKNEYEATYPERKVEVLDSYSTGPEMVLMVEKIVELMEQGLPMEEVAAQVRDYAEKAQLLFALGSLNNLARNGRVNPAVAKVAGVLGIRVVGKATEGRLDPLSKCRGEKRALAEIISLMENLGYQGGKVRISHCFNPAAMEKISAMILEKWPQAQIQSRQARGLVSFYAELNGLLVGFEC
jgi:DegV family protein with EDD domain